MMMMVMGIFFGGGEGVWEWIGDFYSLVFQFCYSSLSFLNISLLNQISNSFVFSGYLLADYLDS